MEASAMFIQGWGRGRWRAVAAKGASGSGTATLVGQQQSVFGLIKRKALRMHAQGFAFMAWEGKEKKLFKQG
jgi:hypothetical protein